MSQIQIHFENLGEWDNFILTALYTDVEGYSCRDEYNSQNLPDEYKGTFAAIVASIAGLEEPWQAAHVVADYQPYTPATEQELDENGNVIHEATEEQQEVVNLTVNARRKSDRARRSFTKDDYPQLMLTDEATIAAFKQLTHMN